MSMNAREFYIACASNSDYVIQAGDDSHTDIPVLASFNKNEPRQKWVLQPQVNDGTLCGVAFVNVKPGSGTEPSTYTTITYSGNYKPLVLAPYKPGSADIDAWNLLGAGGGTLYIAYVRDTDFAWNVMGGDYKSGTRIGLWNDDEDNSRFTFVLASAAAATPAQIPVPSIATSSAELTS